MMSDFSAYVFIFLLIFAMSQLVLLFQYKKALHASKSSLERASVYFEMLKLKDKYRQLSADDLFAGSPTIREYVVNGATFFLRMGCAPLSGVKLKTKVVSFPREEISCANGRAVEILLEYNRLMLRLFKANQPLKYRMLLAKKISALQILFVLVRLLRILVKSRENTIGHEFSVSESPQLRFIPRHLQQF